MIRAPRQIAIRPPRALRACRAAVRRAFTLIELLVAVGAVALIAVGLAAVFGSVGDTVTGGRSVSGFTAYASLLERQLRDDLAKMSRDGFLVIVNQQAEGGDEIELYAGQPAARGRTPAPNQQRPRRIDELLFFRKGEFVSGREPLGAGYTARGNAAMIYYGHGTRQPVDERVNSLYVRPQAVDLNDTTGRLGDPAPLAVGFPNPNRYASQWTLLRLPVVLAGAGGAQQDRAGLFGLAPQYLADSEAQVSGQPAVKSIFRSMENLGPPAGRTIRSAALAAVERGNLRRASGIVDVAYTDLDKVRRSIISSPVIVAGPGDEYRTPSDIALSDLPDPTDTDPGIVAPFAVQQAWMIDALPAPSMGFIAGGGQAWTPGSAYFPDWNALPAQQSAVRVRYESAPPAYLEPMKLPTGRPLERAVRLADQMALTSNVLAPRCTEFIVEWSFGKVADDGRLIWHGAERWVDLDNDGSQDPEETVARPYGDTDDVRFCMPYRLLEPAPAGVGAFADAGDLYGSYPVSPQLIHGFESPGDRWTFARSNNDGVLASFFGYIDPTFNPADPSQPTGGLTSTLPAPFDLALPSASDHLPWAWPKLIRITVSLADPADPAVEQTFQFVFETPGNPAP